MSDQTTTLPNGDTVIIPTADRSIQIFIGDLYKYRLLDQNEDVITGGGKYVGRVNDLVYHFELGWMRVNSVDPTTFVVNLSSAMKNTDDDQTVGEADRYLSTSSGYQSESWRVYLDTRTLPYRLEIDEGFRTYGTKTVGIKIWRGVDTTETGEVISAYYNQNNEYVSDMIPVNVVANVVDSVFSPLAEIVNTAIKAPLIGYTTKDLQEGEYVTLVGYSQDGQPVRSARCIIHKTNVYQRVEDTQRRIASIQLVSPYLSETEPNKLMVPLNINVASLVMRAKVTYTDGKSLTMDVGDETSGAKFMIYGLKYWSPTITGTPQRLSLVYRISPTEEYSRQEGESETGLVTEPYEIVATDVDPSMSLKLFVYPTWQAGINAYVLEYWLYDLVRLQWYRVPSNAIELDQNSRSFDGMDYTTVQTLTVAVKLNMLDPSWGTHRHVQTVHVALLRSGVLPATNWRVRHSSNQAAWYGDDKQALGSAVGAQNTVLDISCGFGDVDTWLDGLFYVQEPLYDILAEAKAPRPTHFVLMTRTQEFDFPIALWNNELTIINDLTEGQSLSIRFVRRDVNGELQLGVTALPLHFQ